MENDANINSPLASILIYYVLLGMTVIYALLLLLLQNLDQSGVSPTEMPFLDIIIIIFAVVSLFDVIVVQMKFMPLVKKQTTIQMVFVNGIFAVTQYNFIAVFGLFIGLIQIFVVLEPVNWVIVGAFILTSLILQIFFLNSVIKPKIQSIQDEMPIN